MERRRIKLEQEESAKKARMSTPIISYQHPKIATSTTAHLPYRPNINNRINIPPQQQLGPRRPSTPVLRYFRTEQGQIIRLPASYLQRGTPLILRHVSPGSNQTNSYIIRPQTTTPPQANPMRIDTPIVRHGTETKLPHQIPQYRLVPQQQQQQQQQENEREKEKEREQEQEQSQPQQPLITQLPQLVSQTTSVGTIANELAHDQHAPGTAGAAVPELHELRQAVLE